MNSTPELLDRRFAWNDLWQRSDCAWPTMRAEPLAQWIDTFSPRTAVRILMVEENGALLAALPLVEERWGPLRIGRLPGGDLCSVGDLLVDRDWQHNDAGPLAMLVKAVARLGWPMVRYDAVLPRTQRWQAFLSAAEKGDLHYLARHRGVTGVIAVRGTWQAYFAGRSRNHRRQMRVVHKRASEAGTLELRMLANPPIDQIESLLRRGFEVEDRGWKGVGGSSTLREPGAYRFFVEQAKLLAVSGHLLLTFLELSNRSIAFEYGWLSKGVYHSLKVGFDEAYRHLSPGQLLRYRMMERLFAGGEVTCVDYLGPLSDATGKWTTDTYPVSRVVMANGKFGRALLRIYRIARRHESAAAVAGEAEVRQIRFAEESAQG